MNLWLKSKNSNATSLNYFLLFLVGWIFFLAPICQDWNVVDTCQVFLLVIILSTSYLHYVKATDFIVYIFSNEHTILVFFSRRYYMFICLHWRSILVCPTLLEYDSIFLYLLC